jgi:hypothetical protein
MTPRSLFLSALLAILYVSQPALADGVFMVVKGDVRLESPGQKAVPARIGMKVGQADKVISGKEGRAKIVMTDKNVLNISPDTELVIETYKFNEAKNEKNVSLNVLYGKVRATVNQKYDDDKNKFQVKTPSAVAGVRGTDFLTQYNSRTGASKIITFEGTVAVGRGLDSSGRIKSPVLVPAGTFSLAVNTRPPTPPRAVPHHELQALNRETNTDGGNRPQPERVPANDKKPSANPDSGQSPTPSDKPSANPEPGPSSAQPPEPTAGGPGPSPDREPAAVGTPPPMINLGGPEGGGSPGLPPPPPVLPTGPTIPVVNAYVPPPVPTDLIQKNTHLTVNIHVH